MQNILIQKICLSNIKKISMKKIFIYNIGCKLRLLDAKRSFDYFTKNNYQLVDSPKKADTIILFTCGVTNQTTQYGLKTIKKLMKYKAELIVAGCMPETDNDRLKEIFNGKTISTKDLDKNPDKFDGFFSDNVIKFSEIGEVCEPVFSFQELEELGPKRFIKRNFSKVKLINKIDNNFRDYVLKNIFGQNSLPVKMKSYKNPPIPVRISWGCRNNCSYCSVKKAVGDLRSKPLNMIVNSFKKGIENGFSNFFLTADDTGSYGIDISSSFPELLNKLTELEGYYEISIMNLNPQWIVKYIDEWEEILKKEKIVAVDIPIQSASKRILNLMRRFADTEKVKDAFLRSRKAYPKLAFNLHVILGFPTETEKDFYQTLKFINETKPNSGAIFPFSCMPNTDVEKIDPKLTKEQINIRVNYAKKYLTSIGYNIKPIQVTNYIFYRRDIN